MRAYVNVVCVCIYVDACMCTDMYICIYMHVYMYVYEYVCMYIPVMMMIVFIITRAEIMQKLRLELFRLVYMYVRAY